MIQARVLRVFFPVTTCLKTYRLCQAKKKKRSIIENWCDKKKNPGDRPEENDKRFTPNAFYP